MPSLSDSILKHCGGISPPAIEAHLQRMPEGYVDRFAPAEIGKHLKLIARLTHERVVEVEIKSLGKQSYEICVVGGDRTGVLAAITTALASDGLDVQDLQIYTYMPAEDESEPTYFVDIARVTSSRKGLVAPEIAISLRDRLSLAFQHLKEGDLAAAQTAASDSHWTHPPKENSRAVGGAVVVKEGMILDGFRLDQKLATGGMSEVYLATQLSLQRLSAVKVVSGMPEAEEIMSRFARETLVLAGFNCPHIVQVYASGDIHLANGSPLRWLAMEYLPNGDLGTWLRMSGPPRVEVGVRWFAQALRGLCYAHQNGVIHRDFKPHNLLLTKDGDIKISDFGLLKEANARDGSLTLHGTVMGTPQYISPEQALAEGTDERSDLYSLGATFFHIFTGRLAFEGKNVTAVLSRITTNPAPHLLEVEPNLPRPLGIIIDRLLSLRAEDRYQTAQVVLDDLNSFLQRRLLLSADGQLTPHDLTRRPTNDMTQAFRPAPITRTAMPEAKR